MALGLRKAGMESISGDAPRRVSWCGALAARRSAARDRRCSLSTSVTARTVMDPSGWHHARGISRLAMVAPRTVADTVGRSDEPSGWRG